MNPSDEFHVPDMRCHKSEPLFGRGGKILVSALDQRIVTSLHTLAASGGALYSFLSCLAGLTRAAISACPVTAMRAMPTVKARLKAKGSGVSSIRCMKMLR